MENIKKEEFFAIFKRVTMMWNADVETRLIDVERFEKLSKILLGKKCNMQTSI